MNQSTITWGHLKTSCTTCRQVQIQRVVIVQVSAYNGPPAPEQKVDQPMAAAVQERCSTKMPTSPT